MFKVKTISRYIVPNEYCMLEALKWRSQRFTRLSGCRRGPRKPRRGGTARRRARRRPRLWGPPPNPRRREPAASFSHGKCWRPSILKIPFLSECSLFQQQIQKFCNCLECFERYLRSREDYGICSTYVSHIFFLHFSIHTRTQVDLVKSSPKNI